MSYKAYFIAGPTASGKSEFALKLAEKIGGALINVDSMQVYRDLHILSARPGEAALQKAPHYLYGHVPGDQIYDVARFINEAMAAYHAIIKADHIPIFVGGTGLYMRALLDGLAKVPDIDPAIRQQVRKIGESSAEELYRLLQSEDPVMAEGLNLQDKQRVARALEVKRSSGRSLRHFHATPQKGPLGELDKQGDIAKWTLLPDREILYERCDKRFDRMIVSGGLTEVKILKSLNLNPDLPVMRALGVPPLLKYLNGSVSLEEAAEITRMQTRRFAKRQYTWIRNQFSTWDAHELKYNVSNLSNTLDDILKKCLTKE